MSGRIEYLFTATPTYSAGELKLFEQVKAKDESGRTVRTAEFERVLTLHGHRLEDGSGGSVWPRVFPGENTADAGPATPAPAPSAASRAP